jgi:hypothetical protein
VNPAGRQGDRAATAAAAFAASSAPTPPPADWPSPRALLVPALVRRRARVALRRLPLRGHCDWGALGLAAAAGEGGVAPQGEVEAFDAATGRLLVRLDGTGGANGGSSGGGAQHSKSDAGIGLLVAVRPADAWPLSTSAE